MHIMINQLSWTDWSLHLSWNTQHESVWLILRTNTHTPRLGV